MYCTMEKFHCNYWVQGVYHYATTTHFLKVNLYVYLGLTPRSMCDTLYPGIKGTGHKRESRGRGRTLGHYPVCDLKLPFHRVDIQKSPTHQLNRNI